nr:DUF6653 family protein [Thalassococcus arenae]
MAMSPEVWARHANPLSGLTRMATAPVLILAIYARAWIGWWSLLPIAVVTAWIWVNTRIFPPPADHGHWMTRVVLGERWFLARHSVTLPDHHIAAAHWLTALSLLGLPPLVWGLWVLDPGWTVAGGALALLPKLWFCDRMVWLYQDQTGSVPGHPEPKPQLPPEETAQ